MEDRGFQASRFAKIRLWQILLWRFLYSSAGNNFNLSFFQSHQHSLFSPTQTVIFFIINALYLSHFLDDM
jgi:hypothetical protein